MFDRDYKKDKIVKFKIKYGTQSYCTSATSTTILSCFQISFSEFMLNIWILKCIIFLIQNEINDAFQWKFIFLVNLTT